MKKTMDFVDVMCIATHDQQGQKLKNVKKCLYL